MKVIFSSRFVLHYIDIVDLSSKNLWNKDLQSIEILN